MTDGCSAWRTVENAIHYGCLVHARRRFDEALRATKKKGGLSKLPLQALKFFKVLYKIEKLARKGLS